jgi:hypothetical protein
VEKAIIRLGSIETDFGTGSLGQLFVIASR